MPNNWRSPPRSTERSAEQGRSYNRRNRQIDRRRKCGGWLVLTKRSNDRGAKGPAVCNVFDHKEGKTRQEFIFVVVISAVPRGSVPRRARERSRARSWSGSRRVRPHRRASDCSGHQRRGRRASQGRPTRASSARYPKSWGARHS